jgi:hypothetical protein
MRMDLLHYRVSDCINQRLNGDMLQYLPLQGLHTGSSFALQALSTPFCGEYL